MKRVYAVVLGLAMLVTVAPGLATADTYAGSTVRQQAIKDVVARALAQRGVPYTYGGGNGTGPTASVAVAPGADAAGLPNPGGAQLASVPAANVPTATVPAATVPARTLPAATVPAPGVPAATVPGVVGFDASGLIQYAFAGVGLKLPRSSGEQYEVGRKVTPAEALPGDLLFYGPEGSQSVALFVGNGQMVEATNPTVKVSPVRTNGMTPYLTRVIEW